MNKFPWGLRMTKYEEQLGADLIEHGLAGHNIAKYSIEKKLNVRNAYSVVKFVAKWKRKTRLSRERRLAEEAAARGESVAMAPDGQRPNVPTSSSTDGQQQQQQQHRLEPLRLGPVNRRGSIQQYSAASGGTLTARPRSGRRHQIEREKNSLPPTMHSSYRVHPMRTIQQQHQQQQHNNSDTSFNMEGGIQNGVLGNGSVPITVIRPPTASSMADITAWHTQQPPPAKETELEQFSSASAASVHAQQPHNSSMDARGGGLLSRMRRNTKVQPQQQQHSVDEVQLDEQRHSPPLSARSLAQTTTTTTTQQQRHAVDGFDEMPQRMRRPESAGDSEPSGRSRQRRHRHNIRVNDSIV